jgi:hypothetical protein
MASILTILRVLPVVVQPILIALMFRRGAHRRYPVFTLYLAVDFVLSNALWFLIADFPGQKQLYLAGYIVYTFTGVVLAFAALFEASRTVLQPYPSLKRLQALVFRVYGALPIVVALVLTLARAHHEAGPLMGSLLVLEIGTRLAQVVLVVSLLLTSKLLRVHWSSDAIGIVLGFGVFAIVDLSLVSLRGRWGPSYQLWFDFFRGFAANLQLVLWLGYFWLQRKPEAVLGATERLHHWDEELAKAMHMPPPPAGSFRDLEAAVDRVMGAPESPQAKSAAAASERHEPRQ